jgi:small subunit ribosomal protein S4
MERLECRLDNVVYRLRFGNTIFAAQQLVSHGHILVDGKKVDRRSFYVRPGMVISVKQKSQTNPLIKQNVESTARDIPEYLALDEGKYSGSMVSSPHTDQIPLPLPINIPLICEFLAHTS